MKTRTITLAEYIMDAPKGSRIEHINGDTLDCRRSNLRVIPPSVDQTGHSGIRRRGGKFRLEVTIDGKKKYVGTFSTRDEALAARDKLPGYSKKQLEHPEESI
jgi:hypothetical protein